MALGLAGCSNSPVPEVWAACKAHPDTMGKLVDTLRAQTDLFSGSAGTYEIDETTWDALEHKTKVLYTAALYCGDANAAGHGTVILRGMHNGKVLASMTDGNYLDS